MLKIDIKRAGMYTDITDSVRTAGCELNYKLGTDEMRYAPDIMDFSIKVTNDDLINYFLQQHLPVEVRASEDDTGYVYFNGYIKPSNDISIKYDYGELNVSCVDSMSIDLKRPCPKAVSIDVDLQTIAVNLVIHAGLQYDFPSEMSNVIVPYFILEEDETDTLNILDDLLWEYGYTLYQKHDVNKIVSARTWFLLVDDTDVMPYNIFDRDTSDILEPLDIAEEEITEQIYSVSWIVAANINRVEEENSCVRGAQLYLHPKSTSEKGVAAIEADKVWPIDGLIIPTYFSYRTKALPDILDTTRERLKIIYGFDQCVQFVGETDDIVLEVQEHSSKQSRLVFKNNASKTVRLRGFLIRGSAIYSQGTYTVLGGIYTEPFEFVSGAVVRSVSQVTYILDSNASDQDGFYNDWILISEYGTNVRIESYAGASKTVTVTEPLKVSEQDIMGTALIIISPDVGLSESKLEAKHLYNDLDARRLCLGLINLVEHGRYSYSFDLRSGTINQIVSTNAPTRDSITARGGAVIIEYNRSLNSFSLPDISAFTVRKGSDIQDISSIAITGNSVILYLTNSVSVNEVITVRYTRPNINSVEDKDGNDASSFAFVQADNVTGAYLDNKPPELRHASIVNNEITLTYDEVLSTMFVPIGSSYVVTEDGEDRTVNSVIIDNRNVLLNITPASRVGTRVYIMYDPPVSNSIRDISGNKADFILNQWVSNNSVLEAQNFSFA